MKVFLIASLCLTIVACVTDPDLSTSSQSICQEDRDNCPGGHPVSLSEATSSSRSYAHAKEALVGNPPAVPNMSCINQAGGTITCIGSDWVSANSWVETDCGFATDGTWSNCTSHYCHPVYSGDCCQNPITVCEVI